MTDPYKTLGVARHGTAAEIRSRYLDLVRQYPPERDAERFAEIRAAYDELRDPTVRMQSLLFNFDSADSIAELAVEVKERLRTARIPTKTLLSLAKP